MIDSFQGEYRWLSNFWPSSIRMPDGLVYPTVEHAFQAHKTLVLEERFPFASPNTISAGQAKRAGRKLTLRDDWGGLKLIIMKRALNMKFIIPDLHALLLETEDEELVEGNDWGDTFWGVCRGKGENNLGKLLMEVRAGLWITKTSH